jgi:hypothetical protein
VGKFGGEMMGAEGWAINTVGYPGILLPVNSKTAAMQRKNEFPQS